MATKNRAGKVQLFRPYAIVGGRIVRPRNGRAFPVTVSQNLAEVNQILGSMDEDQKEIDQLRESTRSNLAKARAILDTF